MSPRSKREYRETVHLRYKNASRHEKTAILDEFCATCGEFGGHNTINGIDLPVICIMSPDYAVPFLRPADDVPGRGDGDRASACGSGAYGTPELVPLLLSRGGAPGDLRVTAPP